MAEVQFDIIQQGWKSLEAAAIPSEANDTQRREMRCAFFAGAWHLWNATLVALDPGADPTANDMAQMEAIEQELQAFAMMVERGLA